MQVSKQALYLRDVAHAQLVEPRELNLEVWIGSNVWLSIEVLIILPSDVDGKLDDDAV